MASSNVSTLARAVLSTEDSVTEISTHMRSILVGTNPWADLMLTEAVSEFAGWPTNVWKDNTGNHQDGVVPSGTLIDQLGVVLPAQNFCDFGPYVDFSSLSTGCIEAPGYSFTDTDTVVIEATVQITEADLTGLRVLWAGDTSSYRLYLNEGVLLIGVDTSTGVVATLGFHTYKVVFSALTSYELYVDGVLQDTGLSVYLPGSASNMYLGCRESQQLNFLGKYHHFSFVNETTSTKLYEYRFLAGTGTTVVDYSGQSNDATIIDAVWGNSTLRYIGADQSLSFGVIIKNPCTVVQYMDNKNGDSTTENGWSLDGDGLTMYATVGDGTTTVRESVVLPNNANVYVIAGVRDTLSDTFKCVYFDGDNFYKSTGAAANSVDIVPDHRMLLNMKSTATGPEEVSAQDNTYLGAFVVPYAVTDEQIEVFYNFYGVFDSVSGLAGSRMMRGFGI